MQFIIQSTAETPVKSNLENSLILTLGSIFLDFVCVFVCVHLKSN